MVRDRGNAQLDLLKRMAAFAEPRLPDRGDLGPDDVASEAYRRAHKAFGGPPPERYVWKALYSTIADIIRQHSREQYRQLPGFRQEPELAEHPEFDNALWSQVGDNELDRRILELRGGPYGERPWTEVARELGGSPERVRQRYSRLLRTAKASLVLKWYEQGRFEEINRYRLPMSLMRSVAQAARRAGIGPGCFEAAFKHVHHNRTIQNATWVLAAMARDHPDSVDFLVNQLSRSNLFRGNRTYIAEALIVLDPKRHGDTVRSEYLDRLHEMPSRVVGDARPPREQPPVVSVCLVDLVEYRPLSVGVGQSDVERLRRDLLGGVDDVDLHRTLTWQLLRIRPGEGRGLQTAIQLLRDELDQTNAYYVTKFIMGPGLRLFRNLVLSRDTYESVRRAAQRWPQNHYLVQSAARLSMKLKAIGA